MIAITKEGSKSYPDIRISDGERSFLIKRENAPDLYWIPDFHPLNDNEDITFTINENDAEIYFLFETLYNDIITGNIFPLEKKDIQNKSEDEIKRLKREKAKQKKENRKLAQDTGLVKDGIIFWHSEDLDPFETAAVLKIEKTEQKIEITFSKNKIHDDFTHYFPTYAIRISESWSIYRSFFCPFVRLHRHLQVLGLEKPAFANEAVSEHQKVIFQKSGRKKTDEKF